MCKQGEVMLRCCEKHGRALAPRNEQEHAWLARSELIREGQPPLHTRLSPHSCCARASGRGRGRGRNRGRLNINDERDELAVARPRRARTRDGRGGDGRGGERRESEGRAHAVRPTFVMVASVERPTVRWQPWCL
jgi:hypothetical protein